MKNLHSLRFYRTNIDDLPGTHLNNQNLRYLLNNDLKSINDFAFFGLKNIEHIDISGSFDFIPSNAFVVENNDYNKDFTISINTSKLRGSSFELNVFTNPNRTLHLEFLFNSKLTYLNETVFGQLFDCYPNSTIDLYSTSVNCSDCNLKWIIDTRVELMSKITNAECSDGQSFYNLKIDDFNHCTPNNGKD